MTESGGSAATARPAFAHASEAELARILDFYDVRWVYEPHTFPIGWNLDGDVVESFSPDFYLPDLDLYVELTTLKQKLVRKKNRKLRRLRELYPGINIKLFYARDFRALLLKFGRLGLMGELTGSSGQATPPRAIDAAPRDPDVDRVSDGSRGASAGGDESNRGVSTTAVEATSFDAPEARAARRRRPRRRRRQGAADATSGVAAPHSSQDA